MWGTIFSGAKAVISFLGGASFVWGKIEENKAKKESDKLKRVKKRSKGRA